MVSKESMNGPKENPKPDETDHLGSEKEKGPENSSREGPHRFNSSPQVNLCSCLLSFCLLCLFVYVFTFVFVTLSSGRKLKTGPWSKTRLCAPNLPDGQQVRSQRAEEEV